MDLKLDHGVVHYADIGEGLMLFALHGGPGDLGQMQAILEPVFTERSGWRRIYFDLPGCGRTQIGQEVDSYDRVLAFVQEFIDEIAAGKRYVLAGYSYGGYLARGVIHQCPGQVAGLCLLAPRVMQDRKLKTVPEPVTLVEDPEFLAQLQEGELFLSEYLVVHSLANLEKMRKHFLISLETYDEGHSERMNAISPGLSFDVDDLETPFQAPTLIITGRQDHATGYQDAWGLLERYPRASFAVLDKAGHFLGMVEQESLVQALISEWLDRVQAEWNGDR